MYGVVYFADVVWQDQRETEVNLKTPVARASPRGVELVRGGFKKL